MTLNQLLLNRNRVSNLSYVVYSVPAGIVVARLVAGVVASVVTAC